MPCCEFVRIWFFILCCCSGCRCANKMGIIDVSFYRWVSVLCARVVYVRHQMHVSLCDNRQFKPKTICYYLFIYELWSWVAVAHLPGFSLSLSSHSILMHTDCLSPTPVSSLECKGVTPSDSFRFHWIFGCACHTAYECECEGVTLRAQLLRNHHNICWKSKVMSKRPADPLRAVGRNNATMKHTW